MNNDIKNPKRKSEGWAHRAGDAIERLGEKIRQAGATTLGNKIYRAGNKLEHINDKKGST